MAVQCRAPRDVCGDNAKCAACAKRPGDRSMVIASPALHASRCNHSVFDADQMRRFAKMLSVKLGELFRGAVSRGLRPRGQTLGGSFAHLRKRTVAWNVGQARRDWARRAFHVGSLLGRATMKPAIVRLTSEGVNNPSQQTHNSSLALRLSHTRRSTSLTIGNQCDQPASRQPVVGIRPSSAPSCSRTGSRSPSIARRKTERANSSGFTVLLPTDLSVHHASSKAFSKSTSVCGSNELLWKPRIVPPHGRFARLTNVRRKVGQVCGPRWAITRPKDHTFLASYVSATLMIGRGLPIGGLEDSCASIMSVRPTRSYSAQILPSQCRT